ncbi:MerC domain-containing protein [Myxococcota bacterium]|nr:MerC domain-containing protein [Myxococcota bacterium]
MASNNKWVLVRPLSDAIGIGGSLLCIGHCLILPVSLVVGMIIPVSFAEDEFLHGALLWAVVPAAMLAFAIGCLHHKDRRVLLLGATGLLALATAFTGLHDAISQSAERWIAVAASGLLIGAHVRNFRLCRTRACDHTSPHTSGR